MDSALIFQLLKKFLADSNISVYTGIEDVDADVSPARYFTLDGIEVAHPQKGVMYIKIQQNKSQKVVY